MKDAVHHLKHVQRKVIQSARKDLEAKSTQPITDSYHNGMEAAVGELSGQRERNQKPLPVRKAMRSQVH